MQKLNLTGNLYKLSKPIVSPVTGKYLCDNVMYFSKLGKKYLVVVKKIFTKDPVEMRYSIITERKLLSFILDDGYIVQKDCPYEFN